MSREAERDAADQPSSPDAAARHYRSLLDALDCGAFRVDADGHFESVDADVAALAGRPAERLEGAHVSTVLADGVEQFERALRRDGAGAGGVAAVDLTVQPADGEPVAATARLERLADGGRLEGAIGVLEEVDGPGDGSTRSEGADVADERGDGDEADDPPGERRADDQEGESAGPSDERGDAPDRYRALTEAASDVVVTIDEDSTVRSINPAVEDLFGYEPEALVGESLTELMPDELAHRHESALDRYLRTGERRLDWDYVELEGQHADGDRIPLAISFGETVRDGESRFTGVIRDITERRAIQRELRRYEALVEESTDVITVVGRDATIEYATPSSRRVLGYASGDLLERDAFDLIHPDDRPTVREEFEALVADPEYRARATFRVRHSDGSWVVVRARGRNLLEDPHVEGVVVYTHDITERRRDERRLEQQRERLSALNQLNAVVRGVTEAVVDRSTRDEIEAITCQRLAASDSYEYAWIGELDPRSGELSRRAEAGADDRPGERNPASDDGPLATAEAAIRAGEIKVVRETDADEDAEFDAIRGGSTDRGSRSFAAVPIGHEDTIYGVVGVYADRPDAFRNEERTVISHLGDIVGHAIAATERKQALMSDSVLELEIEIGGLFAEFDDGAFSDATARIERVLSVEDGRFLVYGVADEPAVDILRSIREEIDHWGEVTVISEAADGVRFEVELAEPPLLSAVASLGGSVRHARIEDGDYRLVVQFPQGTDARRVLETVRDRFPDAEVLARRQVTRSESASERFTRAWLDRLTERQRTALEVAYYAGFFEWPRDSSGEEVADSIDVSPPTFHQHVRAAERKLFGALLEEAAPGGTE